MVHLIPIIIGSLYGSGFALIVIGITEWND